MPAAICSLGSKTCGACCWGCSVSREELTSRLRRNRRLFAVSLASRRMPGTLALLAHELGALRVEEVLCTLLQGLPLLGPRLRLRVQARIVCPFAAFRDRAERRVGCLLHPRRWRGRDVRARVAFRLLPGFGCGDPAYACAGAVRFQAAGSAARRLFEAEAAGLDWYSYSAAAPRFRAEPASAWNLTPHRGAQDARDRLQDADAEHPVRPGAPHPV